MRYRRLVAGVSLLLALAVSLTGQARPSGPNLNKPERVEWFRDLGFGLFIHWSLDSQVGSVISHSLVGASEDYIRRFFVELPKTFNPKRFDPDDWAVLAKLAGFRYMVFTTKHHSGFCMFNTRTTPFSIMNTPYGKDITAELTRAFRDQGIAVGYYFSPDDFWFLHREGIPIARHVPEVAPHNNRKLLAYDQEQLRELARNYGPIGMWFLDGPEQGLKEICWQEQPDSLVTRGAMETPEQYTPGVPLEGAWEGNLTMGTQWQYKPTNENYKSGTQLIETLIETRAKGGNLLLNIGPKSNGELPIEQEERLREMALWMSVNSEAIYEVRPWVITNEGDIWFTKRKDENTVYAFVTRKQWRWGEREHFSLRSVRATGATKVSVLGQNDEVLEYRPDIIPKSEWKQEGQELRISAVRAQRLYNDRRWPNPVVLKITHAEAGLEPPKVSTIGGAPAPGGGLILRAELRDLGRAAEVEAGFQFRPKKGTEDLYEADAPWTDTPLEKRRATGPYEARVTGIESSRVYEIRAVVRHPAITMYGLTVEAKAP